jgi:hypothetical protein
MASDDHEIGLDDGDDVPQGGLAEALRKLPLCDELYLGMQAMNLDLVDQFLEAQEARLLAEYMEDERTHFPTVMFVSALSQMWVFALYELLRTWRQRARDLLRSGEEVRAAPAAERHARLKAKKREIEGRAGRPDRAVVFHSPAYEEAAADPQSLEPLRKAVDRTERLFRRVEALRMSLAKHEMPGVKGSHAMAPGYGRIDMLTGSISWQVLLRGNEVDLISRRRIADDCRRLAIDRDVLILPEPLQDIVRRLPDHSYGVKRIAVVLDDGTTYDGVYIGWSKEVLRVEEYDEVPFDVTRVREVRHDPLSERTPSA